mmetsp:Transcript_4786/g.14819  ORF Transcript_4786/g.14819 Transcript_4786/m.14819 type:complete len:150 (-) Transcript_4786:731-1180(-)
MVAGWRLSSVNHTGWLSSRGADDAAEARRAEEAGSWEWEGSDQVAIEAVMVLIDAETISARIEGGGHGRDSIDCNFARCRDVANARSQCTHNGNMECQQPANHPSLLRPISAQAISAASWQSSLDSRLMDGKPIPGPGRWMPRCSGRRT